MRRGSPGYTEGRAERTSQAERNHVHTRAWQAGEPLGFRGRGTREEGVLGEAAGAGNQG